MSSTEVAAKMFVLKSSDDQSFEVEESVAVHSEMIKQTIEDCPDSKIIRLPNVTGNILALVTEYCKKHVDAATVKPSESVPSHIADADLKEFDEQFINVDLNTMYDLLMASNYLNIKGLLDLACQTVADMIKGKMPEQIRQEFNIVNDFEPEEEEKIRRENAWAFDN